MREQARQKQEDMRQQAALRRGDASARANEKERARQQSQADLNAQMQQRYADQNDAASANAQAANDSLADLQNRTKGLKAPPPPKVDTTEMVGSFVETVQLIMEVMYGAILGVQNIPMLIPAVLSMVTGMLKAALAVKILVPGSSLPGVFIIVLPLVTTPIFWSIFNVIFQIVGGLDLLLGLMLLAFLPTLNTFIGTWKQVAQPMSDAQIADFNTTMTRITSALSLLMVATFGFFIYKVHTAVPVPGEFGVSSAAKMIVGMLGDPIKLLSMLVATFSKKFYTALVCVDYMVGTIVADRKYEKYLLELKKPPPREGCCSRKKKTAEDAETNPVGMGLTDGTNLEEGSFEKEGEKPAGKTGLCGRGKAKGADEAEEPEIVQTEEEEMRELLKNKQVRLDDLCRLLYVGEDEEWMAKKKLGIAAAREMRKDTWTAAAKTTGRQPSGTINVVIHRCSVGAVKPVYVVLELEQKDEKGLLTTTTFTTDEGPDGADLNSSEFHLPVYDISAVMLYAHVYESVVGLDNFMGEVVFDTKEVIALMSHAGQPQEPTDLAVARCTQPAKVGKERFQQEKMGSISATVGFDFPQLALGTMQVKVVKGSDLLAADKGYKGAPDTSDPFVIVAVHQKHDGKETEQKFVTEKIMKTVDPEWNVTFFYDIWDLDAAIYLDVYDSDLDADDYLGQGKLSLRDFCVEGETGQHTIKLTPCMPGRGLPKRATDVMDVTGTVLLELTFSEDRSRLELKSGLDAKLEELIAARGFSEQQAAAFRQASDEQKMEFLRSSGIDLTSSTKSSQQPRSRAAPAAATLAAPPVARRPPAAATPPAATTSPSKSTSDAAQQLFSRVDTDANGVLSLDEFATWWSRRSLITGKNLDASLMENMRAQWDKLDLDGSGDLDAGEFATFLAELAASEWQEHYDSSKGRSYYHNAKTGETRWQEPDNDSAVAGFMETNGLVASRKPPSLASLQTSKMTTVNPLSGSAGANFEVEMPARAARALPQRDAASPSARKPPDLVSLQASASSGVARELPPRAVPARPAPAVGDGAPRSLPPRVAPRPVPARTVPARPT